MEIQPPAIIAGFMVGALTGLTGIGGGSLMTPLLILVMGVRPAVAVGTDLVQMAVTKAFGAWQHWRQGSVDVRLAFRMAAGSIPGVLAGVGTLALLRNVAHVSVDPLITRILGGLLPIVAVGILARLVWPDRLPRWDLASVPFSRYAVPLVAGVIGFLVGVSSVGSGALVALLLLTLFRVRSHRVVGTDVFHALLLVSVGGLAHLGIGNVDLALAGNLVIGSVPGVLLGSRLTVRMPEAALRVVLSLTLMAIGFWLL